MESPYLSKEYKKRVLPVWMVGDAREKQEYKKNIIDKQTIQRNLEKKQKDKKTQKRLSKCFPYLERHPVWYTCSQLKDHCLLRGLPVSGLKTDLVKRVFEYEEKNNFINWPSERKQREKRNDNFQKMWKLSHNIQ